MRHAIETITSDHFAAELVHDEDCGNPFVEWDQVGILATNPRKHFTESQEADWYDAQRAYYRLGVKISDYGSSGWKIQWERIPPGFAKEEPDWLGDCWTRSTLERYDAIIYTTRKRAEQLHSGPKTTSAQIWEALEQEADVWRQWMNGECYGVVIHTRLEPESDDETHAGDYVDSCWGYLGYADPLEPARDMLAEAEAAYAAEQAKLAVTGEWVRI